MRLHGLLNWLACLRWQGESSRREPLWTSGGGSRSPSPAPACSSPLPPPWPWAGCVLRERPPANGPPSSVWGAAWQKAHILPTVPCPFCAPCSWPHRPEWLLRPTGEPKLRRCAGVLFALLFLTLALRGNLWGLRSWLLSLPLTRRLLNPGEGLSRLEIWSAFFRGGRWLRFPLGGNWLTQGLPFTWFHNLWLDLYCHGGALPFLLFSAFTLLELRHSLAFFRTMKAVRWERSRNAAANLLPALLLNAMVEPVIEANVYVFLTALLFLGSITSPCPEGGGSIPTKYPGHTVQRGGSPAVTLTFITNYLTHHTSPLSEASMAGWGQASAL